MVQQDFKILTQLDLKRIQKGEDETHPSVVCTSFMQRITKNLHNRVKSMPKQSKVYRTRTIISHGLYIFYPIFHCGLYCRAVNIKDNYVLNKVILQFLSLQSTVYNWDWVIMAHVRHFKTFWIFSSLLYLFNFNDYQFKVFNSFDRSDEISMPVSAHKQKLWLWWINFNFGTALNMIESFLGACILRIERVKSFYFKQHCSIVSRWVQTIHEVIF